MEFFKAIDFNHFLSYVFIIENNSHQGLGNNQIRDLMISNGYIYFARIWNLDDIFIHPDLLVSDWGSDYLDLAVAKVAISNHDFLCSFYPKP